LVIHIGFHLVSLPCRLSGTLTVCFGTIVLVPVAGNKKLAAVNTRNLVHIAAPFNTMNKNNYMDLLSFLRAEFKKIKWLELKRWNWMGIRPLELIGN
jgi:hypothetical protein